MLHVNLGNTTSAPCCCEAYCFEDLLAETWLRLLLSCPDKRVHRSSPSQSQVDWCAPRPWSYAGATLPHFNSSLLRLLVRRTSLRERSVTVLGVCAPSCL